MTKLSVNINKIATIRNARGGNTPNVVQAAIDIENFGAEGITVHPRPDQRHITFRDAYDLKKVVKTEYNIEGYPSDDFIEMVLNIKPHQVTLVPDKPDDITSNAGWDCIKEREYLTPIIKQFKEQNIRVSVFLDPEVSEVEAITTDFFKPSGPSVSDTNSWTSLPLSPIKPITFTSAEEFFAIMPIKTLLPTPDPANRPNL